MRNIIGALAALSLMAVPVAASAAEGTKAAASAGVERASPATAKKAKRAVGGALPIIIALVGVGVAIAIIASDDSDDSLSP